MSQSVLCSRSDLGADYMEILNPVEISTQYTELKTHLS